MNRFSILSIFLFTMIIGCHNKSESSVKAIPGKEAVFFDYAVWAEEDKDFVNILLKFRQGGENDSTIILEAPSKVEVDGKILEADSSKMSGIYYELQTPVDSFTGKHQVVFTSADNKEYKEQFEFKPFRFKTGFPDTIHRANLVLEFENLNDEDYIRITAIDTSFKSRGINDVDTLKGGQLLISKERLKNLVNGPVRIEFYKEEEKPVKNSTSGGGLLSITYGLKRQFELVD